MKKPTKPNDTVENLRALKNQRRQLRKAIRNAEKCRTSREGNLCHPCWTLMASPARALAGTSRAMLVHEGLSSVVRKWRIY